MRIERARKERPALQPGVYGIMVRRRVPAGVAPCDWEFSNQDGGFLWPSRAGSRTFPGVVQFPSDETIHEWTTYVLEALEEGCEPLGGWGPARSCQVRWIATKETYLYRAGDNDMWDIEQCQSRRHHVDLLRLEDRISLYSELLRIAAASSHRVYEDRIEQVIGHEWESFARVVLRDNGLN
jgi:hypothetical protein